MFVNYVAPLTVGQGNKFTGEVIQKVRILRNLMQPAQKLMLYLDTFSAFDIISPIKHLLYAWFPLLSFTGNMLLAITSKGVSSHIFESV